MAIKMSLEFVRLVCFELECLVRLETSQPSALLFGALFDSGRQHDFRPFLRTLALTPSGKPRTHIR
jgi:hypothetical protein